MEIPTARLRAAALAGISAIFVHISGVCENKFSEIRESAHKKIIRKFPKEKVGKQNLKKEVFIGSAIIVLNGEILAMVTMQKLDLM